MGGVARRAWAKNENSIQTSIKYNEMEKGLSHITLPYLSDENRIEGLVQDAFENRKNV